MLLGRERLALVAEHPECPRDVAALAAGQDRLLAAAASMLRPGGRLVYAVCSLQPEEGPQRAQAALRSLPLRPEPFTEAELAAAPGYAPLRARLKTILDSKDRIPYVSLYEGRCYNLWRDADHERALAAMALYAPLVTLTTTDAVLARRR